MSMKVGYVGKNSSIIQVNFHLYLDNKCDKETVLLPIIPTLNYSKIRAGVTQRNTPPYKMTPRVILLRRGMTRVIILRRKMTPDRRKRTPSSSSRMTPS